MHQLKCGGTTFLKQKSLDLQTNLACARTRLLYIAMHRSKKYVKRAVINSLDDCFDFISEPLYGFRVNVTFKCLNNGWCTFWAADDKNGEFTPDAPPECRQISVC